MERWRQVVCSGVEIWWNVGSKNGETRGWTPVHPAHRQVCHWWRWYGLWHRHRIRSFVKVTIILAQGEWSSAKDIGPFFKRCNARHRQTFSTLEASVFMGKNYSEKTYIPSTIQERSHFKTDVRHIWKLIIEQSSEIFGVSQISWEGFPWRQLSLINDEEVISLSHAKVYVFSDSVLCLG